MRCSRDDATRHCDARHAAQRAGEMYYSIQLRGWIFPADARRPCGEPPFFLWPFCPFCGGTLPDTESVMGRILKPWDDNDG